MAAPSQRWRVSPDGGLVVRTDRVVSSQELPLRLPKGAIISELELEGEDMRYLRVSSEGPQTGWISTKSDRGEELLEKFVPTKRKAPESAPAQPPAVRLARPSSEVEGKEQPEVTGSQWTVIAEEGLVARKGQRTTSQKIPGRLSAGVIVEEIEVVGDRLHFTNASGVGPSSGWVSIADKGQELMQRLPQPSDPSTSFEGMKRGFLGGATAELYPEGSPEGAEREGPEKPLEGWASLSQLYGREDLEAGWRPQPGAAMAAETVGRRRRAPREELPPVDDLETLDEAALIDLLGFDDMAAKEFAGLPRGQKRKMIAEAKALIEMGPEKRLEALEEYKRAWPKGPFPELTPPVEDTGAALPPGSCFPYSRHLRQAPSGKAPEWGLEAPAGSAVSTFFRRRTTSTPEAQKEFLRSLKCEVTSSSGAVSPEAGVGYTDPCTMGDLVDKEQLANTIVSKSAARPEDVCRYFNGELQQRICLLDGGMLARIEKENLEESDYRGERFKNFKETSGGQPISLKGNIEMLVLTKASLIADIHKEYMQAGSDIVRTNTYGCNALTQKQYKMNKLVFEMNKSAAQLAKKAASEVTKKEPKKPRFVAGVIGPTTCMMSLTPGASWTDMVEAYDEQVKGLVEGGVDILALEGITDALNAKAAVFAIDEFFEKTKKKRIPLMISAEVAAGRTPSGQSAEAFYISVKHGKPLAVGVSSQEGPGSMKSGYKPLADLSSGWCSASPSAGGADPEKFASEVGDYAKEGILNFVGGGADVLPAHIAAAAKRLVDGSARKLPGGKPNAAYLQLSGLDACLAKPENGLQIVGSQCTVMGSAKFKKKISAYKTTGKTKHLEEAMEVCLEQCEKGADILDFNLDSDLASGPACPAKGAMSVFMRMASAEPKVAKVPFMLCSCEWNTIKEGLKCVQGKCIVNGITLTLGQEEFLRIAKECKRFGAALVVLAITDDGEPAETHEDKVRICQQSYKLLRSKLDFPAEDIIFDCHALLLGLPEFAARASNFISAVGELKRTCPGASFVGGVNNISLPFRGLNMLRDALHSVLLYHAVPKGLNLAIAWPGALPPYSELDAETRSLCEELILNRSSHGLHMERFTAFVNFRSNSVACLPVQLAGPSAFGGALEGSRVRAEAVRKEARESQRELRAQRKASSASAQKSALRSLQCNIVCNTEPLKAEAGAAPPDPCRMDGFMDRDGLANTVVAKGTARFDDLAKYLNAELRKRVCVMATPGQEKKFAESDYKEYFSAGCDICGTNTLKSTTYDESKSAAQMAKSAASDVTKKDSKKPRFVAGVIGTTSDLLSSSPSAEDPSARSATWDELVAVYSAQVRGLVDGGADLLAIEMVSDTLNAKAAIFALDSYFEQTRKERPPLVITAVIGDGGKMPSGQSAEAFLVSVRHARPLSVGVSGPAGSLKAAARALGGASLSWCHAGAGPGESAEVAAQLASDKLVNFVSACGVPASQVGALAGKVASATPRPLPSPPRSPALQLAGLEAYSVGQGDSFHIVGQRCNMGGSKKFRGFVDAYKYAKEGCKWEAARDLCSAQCEAGADILDFNFDSELTDSKSAIGKFMRICARDPKVATAPFVLSSMKWPVIEEGLRSVQGKSIVNAISLAQGEEEFLHMAKACRRYGAAVVVMTIDTPDEFPTYSDKVRIGQRAYKLLRTKLDFPAEDIIFDCNVLPVGSQASAKDFVDAVAELKRSCPLVSFIGGVSNLSLPYRSVPVLREAMHGMFLHHAIPMGLNLAFIDPGLVPRYGDIEAQTKDVCEAAILQDGPDSSALDQLESFAGFLSGSAVEEIPTALVQASDLPVAIPLRKRSSPGFSQAMHTLVQGTGTINASVFQTFGSKCHTATIFHKNMSALPIKRSVWFSSISAWMGQGGSGPITGCSSLMDCIALYERWQQLGNVGVSVEWGAIGEIGLRRTVYGSRDVFAQFDLGQKLIGPADTQMLMRQTCVGGPDPYEVVAMAYLDQTWQMTLAGVTAGGALERKSFADM